MTGGIFSALNRALSLAGQTAEPVASGPDDLDVPLIDQALRRVRRSAVAQDVLVHVVQDLDVVTIEHVGIITLLRRMFTFGAVRGVRTLDLRDGNATLYH